MKKIKVMRDFIWAIGGLASIFFSMIEYSLFSFFYPPTCPRCKSKNLTKEEELCKDCGWPDIC
ncbi:MAG: hypothetical protein ACD_7C00270G0003 [uncultured bacterium]|nr:MAG: hypothetical protein ACD_7C00270G0003 [uncultured bacterium]HBR79906.1 hypothetical protein [Candidatus Moranbacteria bacterium]